MEATTKEEPNRSNDEAGVNGSEILVEMDPASSPAVVAQDDNENCAEENSSNVYEDHFTLQRPTSRVRFRGSTVIVGEMRDSQIQLAEAIEESAIQLHHDRPRTKTTIVVKDIKNDRSSGLNLLRLLYSVVTFFLAGMLFIVCFQVLLFLFMDLVADAGLTSGGEQASAAKFAGTLLSLPVFLYGLASAMAMAGAFVADVWNGHPFINTVGNFDVVYTEWTTFVVLLGAPVAILAATLYSGTELWWTITLLAWFSLVTAYYVIFAFMLMYYEIEAGWLVLQELHPTETTFALLRRAIIHRQVWFWSGTTDVVHVTSTHREDEIPQIAIDEWYTKCTLAKCWTGRLFEPVDPPQRVYSTEDILGTRRFVTAYSWSLEKVFCSARRIQAVNIIQGPSALTPAQVMSSFVCSIGGVVLTILLLASVMVWFRCGGLFIGFVVLVIILACFPRAQSSVRLFRLYRDAVAATRTRTTADVNSQSRGDVDLEDFTNCVDLTARGKASDGMYQTFETYRVSQPTNEFCWAIFAIEIGFFGMWPLVSVFKIGNYVEGAFFVVLGIICFVRYYFNPAVLLKELGTIDMIGETESQRGRKGLYVDRRWRAKSRVASIMLNVSRGPARDAWIFVFLFLAIFIIIFAVAALNTGETTTSTSGSSSNSSSFETSMVILPRNAFRYEPQPNLMYPTCLLAKGLELPSGNATGLADYAFLAALAYQPQDLFEEKLDRWFAPGTAVSETRFVAEFRSEVAGGAAAVSYDLVNFDSGALGVVVVRGSTTAWEWLTDAQLWSGALIAGGLRLLMPFGQMWTPILDNLLKAVGFVQPNRLQSVALYQQTSDLIRTLQASGNYSKVHITGQSLGGGIALISGAQTNVPAIAISGPNLMMSRKTFIPEVNESVINNFLFNVIPDRDIVPRVDDPGILYQRISCRGSTHDMWACHSSVRSLCEIMYKCGSFNRPPVRTAHS